VGVSGVVPDCKLRGYRGVALAIGVGGATIFGIAIGWYWLDTKQQELPEYTRDKEVEAGYYPGGQSCNPLAIGPFPDREQLGYTEACQEAREEYRLKANDLVQQTRAADAAQASAKFVYPQALFSLLGMGFGFLTLSAAAAAAIYARRAASETKRANDIATNTAAIDARPWLSIRNAEITVLGFHQDDEGESFGVMHTIVCFDVHNSGKTPAVRCTHSCKGWNPSPPGAETGLEDRIARARQNGDAKGYSVAPDYAEPIRSFVSIEVEFSTPDCPRQIRDIIPIIVGYAGTGISERVVTDVEYVLSDDAAPDLLPEASKIKDGTTTISLRRISGNMT
jgi:hypothetical protein